MLDRLFGRFTQAVDTSAEGEDSALELAAAALMMEVARSDNNQSEAELGRIAEIAARVYHTETAALDDLLESAASSVEEAHDLYQFTKVINERLDYESKRKLIFHLWQVAFADGNVEANEDHIVRRVAGLLHIAHGDFIREKHRARDGHSSR